MWIEIINISNQKSLINTEQIWSIIYDKDNPGFYKVWLNGYGNSNPYLAINSTEYEKIKVVLTSEKLSSIEKICE